MLFVVAQEYLISAQNQTSQVRHFELSAVSDNSVCVCVLCVCVCVCVFVCAHACTCVCVYMCVCLGIICAGNCFMSEQSVANKAIDMARLELVSA